MARTGYWIAFAGLLFALPSCANLGQSARIHDDGMLPVTSRHWKPSDFGQPGEVRVDAGVLYLEVGEDLTGVTWEGPLLRMGYEITLDAMRVEGGDFFCGLTFPVGDTYCSLIVGGWGGSLVGLSNLDYEDAANNETGRNVHFDNNRWYAIRVRVGEEKIEAWIDEEQWVDVSIRGRDVDVRWEMENSKPLGLATWQTKGAYRNIRQRALGRGQDASGN